MKDKKKISDKVITIGPLWWIYDKITDLSLKKDLRGLAKLAKEYSDRVDASDADDQEKEKAAKMYQDLSESLERLH